MHFLKRLGLTDTVEKRRLTGGAVAGVAIMAANKLGMLGVAILFARSMGLESYGVYAFCIALAPLLGVAVEFGTGSLLLRRTAIAQQRGGAHSRLRLASGALYAIALNWTIVAIALGAAIAFGAFGADRTLESSIALALAFVLAAAILRLVVSQLYGRRQLVAAQTSELLVMPVVLIAGGATVLLLATGPLSPEIAIALHIAGAVLAAAIGYRCLRSGTHPTGKDPGGRLPYNVVLGAGLPFLLINAALLLNTQIDTVLVGLLIGTAETGSYRIGAQVAMISLAVTAVLGSVTAPYFAQLHKAGDIDRMRRLYGMVRWIGVACLAIFLGLLALFGKQAIVLAFGSEFTGAYPITIILTAGYVLNFLFGPAGNLLAMTGHERIVSRVLWATSLYNLVASIGAALWGGAVGVAIVTASSLIAYHFLLRRQISRLVGF